MITTTAIERWLRKSVVGGAAAALLGSGVAGAGEAVEAPGVIPPAAVQAVPAGSLTLVDCLRMALEQQPAIAACRASLAAAETNRRGLDKLPTLMSRTLPVRRKQAELAVTIASEQVRQREDETAFVVTRLYYSVLYAQAQRQVAQQVVERLTGADAILEVAIGKGDAKETDRLRLTTYRRLAESRLEEARVGEQRALAALRETLGGCQQACQPLPLAGNLPDLHLQTCCKDVVELALARRHEVIEVLSLEEVFRLEVDAQGMSLLPREYTFAAGGDLHSRSVPQGSLGKEYVPSAVGPEMPPMLFGCRKDRVGRAQDLYARMAAVVEKTRGLIVLEAEDAFLKWEEASVRVRQADEAVQQARRLAKELLEQFNSNPGRYFKDYLEAVVLEGQATANWNEMKFNRIVAAANLARVTAGGICLDVALPIKQP
jgi:outer membrane protein TolC